MNTINPKDVIITNRVRKNVGWLDTLERSIKKHGMLQPIGITTDNVLVFGERRLKAAINIGLESIPYRVIDVNPDDPATFLKMERDENNERRDFTPEEKIAIAQAIEAKLAGRQGQRTDLEHTPNLGEVKKGETATIAAESIGMKPETYRKAKTVFSEGDEETKEAVNKGEKSIHKAYVETKAKQKPVEVKEKRIWRLVIDIDNQSDLDNLADKIVEEVNQNTAIALAERILKRYGKLEIPQ